MELLTGDELLYVFNELCKNAVERFWVVSPFLGDWSALVKEVFKEDIFKRNLKVKLITDISNTKGIDKETLRKFIDNGDVKTLEGLHAKLYIIDNKVLITSANLSETAFCRRYEIGTVTDLSEELNQKFSEWWELSNEVKLDDIKTKEYNYTPSIEASNGFFLKPLWRLPEVEEKEKYENNDLINILRHRIGNTFFVDYYWDLKNESISNKQIIDSLTQYAPSSRKTRVYVGRKIFRDKLNIEALNIIRKSENQSIQDTISRANEIYLKETSINSVNILPRFNTKLKTKFQDYDRFYEYFNDFAELYRPFRLWKNSPFYFEVDSFLNYLYHEHPNRPSNQFSLNNTNFKSVVEKTKEERIKMLKGYFYEFKLWLSSRQANDNERNRINKHNIIIKTLSKNNISYITTEDARKVLNCLNCMTSRKSNISEFLDLRPNVGNDIISIRKFWNVLIHGENNIIERMHECEKNLRSFGTSATQELIAFYYPEEFPIRNTNVNSGLRLFGYKVSDN